jgi:hypothetical protein
MLSTHLLPCLPSDLFLSGFPLLHSSYMLRPPYTPRPDNFFIPNFFKIRFDITLLPTPISPKFSVSLIFLNENIISHTCHVFMPS